MNRLEDELREHVEILATNDGRAMGTAGHARARKYLITLARHLGLQPYAEEFEIIQSTGAEELVNIVGVAPGLDRTVAPILIGAHYDTFGRLPGADDNAAAIAITLELARCLVEAPAACDVIIAFFDNEEYGFLSRESMGSVVFYNEKCAHKVRAALIMDLVGHDVVVPEMKHVMFVKGIESSSSWFSILRDTEPESGLHWAATINGEQSTSTSDHYIYAKNKEPFLYFTCARWQHYHEPTDTPEKLNYSKMAIFQKALLGIVYSTATREIESAEYDSTQDELYFLNKNVIPFLGISGFRFRTRQDIDELINGLKTKFGL
jgi:Predicted aminopeptidases